MKKIVTLLRLAKRSLTGISPRLQYKAARFWVFGGLLALRAWKRRLRRNELFPPFLFFALTNACNLRCRGCWIEAFSQPDELPLEAVERAINEAAKQSVWFHTLLGGEPFLYPDIWKLIERHPKCYFQIITNALLLDREAAKKIRRLGNVTPLLSIDGPEDSNDRRRGIGSYEKAMEACHILQKEKILYGIATVVTADNIDQVMSEQYVKQFIDLGATYLWYYIFRPVGSDPAHELTLTAEQIIQFRRRLLELRKKMPIVLIDTYWDAKGRAVCPAAKGMGFHIGPNGSIEPCPPLSVCCERITDHEGDLFKTINQSTFLRHFQQFVNERTNGCVILEHPQALADFFASESVEETSGRSFLDELRAAPIHPSHHQSDNEIPEDFWFYKILKKTLFFGMGGYG